MVIKKFEFALLISLIFTIALSCIDFSYQCNGIRSKVLRLHILANSDSNYDQNLKIKVRDRLLVEGLDVFYNTNNLDEAIHKANVKLNDFQSVAKDELQKNGCDYKVTACVTDSYFNTRTYGDTTLPAGTYKALEIKIGKSQGHNWWCVMYPSLCLSSSGDKISDVLNNDETELVENKNKYIAKFKIVELYEDIKSFFN